MGWLAAAGGAPATGGGLSFDAQRDLAAILEQGSHGLEAMEQEAFALRYAVLVVDRDGSGPATVAAERLAHAVVAMRGPGSPPMALIAVGRFDGDPDAGDVGAATLPDGTRALLTLALPG